VIFLVEYDRSAGSLIQFRAFASKAHEEADFVRLQLEIDNIESNTDREVVLLEAENEDQLRLTHRRYFESLSALANTKSVSRLKNSALPSQPAKA
jgi:hypothetical protein